MIRTLVDISQGRTGDPLDGHFVSTGRTLLRERLVTHMMPLNGKPPYKWAEKGRTHHWEITAKGKAILEAIAYDLGDFIEEVSNPAARPALVEARWESVSQARREAHAARKAKR